MNENSNYVLMLETLVMSLLNQRPDVLQEIVVEDSHAPLFAVGCTFSPLNVVDEIEKQRRSRENLNESHCS